MNLKPPPERTGDDKRDLDAMFAWAEEVYEAFKYPAFHILRMVPRAEPSDTAEGNIYMNSTSHILMCRNDGAWVEVGDMT